jgi:hypothetical protein
MKIEINFPNQLANGRRSSLKKGIIDALQQSINLAPNATSLEHTPKDHETAREEGKQIGVQIAEKIKSIYPEVK